MTTGERFGSIFEGGSAVGLGPAELLERFAASRDERAFSAIVARHGPMVLATCRRILPDHADADDAFQATFLVLARKASSITDPARLAPWLHGVARRVAVRARSESARRREVEGEDRGDVAVAPPSADARELRSVLDEELSRLPAKYRDPLVLCYLEGLTHDEAAGQLSWPVGTVRSRLAGARDRLRTRLARRGYAPSDVQPVPLVTVPLSLIRATVRFATGTGNVPARVAMLTKGAWIAMTFASQIKTLAFLGLLAGLTTGGAAVVAYGRRDEPGPRERAVGQTPAPPPKPAAVPPKPAEPKPVPETSPLTVSGRALDSLGQPISGARIYLASCANDAALRLGEIRTDAAGSYQFENVPLPIRPHIFRDPKLRVEGVFQVFGLADGFGFAWKSEKRVRFAPLDLPVNSTLSPTDFVKPGEPVALDLSFPPSAPLLGRVTDDKGQPLADTRVWISACSKPRLDQPILVDEVAVFRGTKTVPPEMNRRRTDADGRFTFDNLPPDHWFELDIQPQGFPSRRVAATMMTKPGTWPEWKWSGRDVLTGSINLVFATPREVKFRVIAGDTGQPLEKAYFSAGGVGDGGSASGITDADGRCVLPVAAGEGGYSALPRFTTPYLETRGKFTVVVDGPTPTVEVAVRPACTLEVTVTDADTGQPIADVDLWDDGPNPSEPDPGRQALAIRSFEAPQLVHSGRVRTDAAGKLRTFAEPGPRRVGVLFQSRADGRVAVEPDGQAIDGKPGETLRLTFMVRRSPGASRSPR